MSAGALSETIAALRFGEEWLRGFPQHLARRDETGAGLGRRLWEQTRLLFLNGVTTDDYYAYALQRPELPWPRKRQFLGSLRRWRWLDPFNPPGYRFFTTDKLVFKRFVIASGLPTPRLLAVTGPNGCAESGTPLSDLNAVAYWLESTPVAQVVFKPALGSRGAGVLILGDRRDKGWELVPDGFIDTGGILAHLRQFEHQPRFLVEERMRPHPDLADLCATVVHSARIVTVLDRDVEVVSAALRIATGASGVDNFSKGNVAAAIGLEDGRLSRAVRSKARSLERLTHHPITGAPIEGRVVPDWPAAVALVQRAARTMPFNRALGWDIAFSASGPSILEANDLWDPDVSQIAPDRGLLETGLRAHLERAGCTRRVGLWAPPPVA